MRSKSTESPVKDRTPWKRRLAQMLCLVLGIVGSFPIFAGLLLRNSRVQRWTDATTERLLTSELGLSAKYRATLELWPLQLRVDDLSVASTSGPPALRVGSVRLRPRLFSLLAGRLDLGDVQVLRPELHIKMRDGKLANLSYHLPPSRLAKGKPNPNPPFASITVADAKLDLDIDGSRIQSQDIDIDVFAKRGPDFDITVRDERTIVDMQHDVAATKKVAAHVSHDEDVFCNLELRAQLTPKKVRIRRFSVSGVADLDPKSATRGSCGRTPSDTDPRQVSINVTDFVTDWTSGKAKASGKVTARLPLAPVDRFVKVPPLQGWVSLNAQLKWDTTHSLPEMAGRIGGAGIQLERYQIADKLDTDFSIERDILTIRRTELVFAEGRTIAHDTTIRPLEKDAPFTCRLVETHGMTFPGLMRALGVTERTIVSWNFGEGQVTDIKGQLALPHIEGHLRTDTHDFEVFDRAFNDPARRHMIGVPRALIRGRLVVQPGAFQFQDTVATFGQSQVSTPLVSIGFDNALDIVVDNKGSLNLADISPITTIAMSGRSRLSVRLAGNASDPVLTGNLAVRRIRIRRLSFGEHPIGQSAVSPA